MNLAEGTLEAIQQYERFEDEVEAAAFWSAAAADVPAEELEFTDGSGNNRRAVLYRGGDQYSLTLIYIHGGGWIRGSVDAQRYCASGLAVETPCNVISISYRLAPEHPFPAALEDCRAALRWIRSSRAPEGTSRDRVSIGGPSAGANLAAATMLAEPSHGLESALLIFGVFGCDFDTSSCRRYADGPLLSRKELIHFFDQYDPGNLRSSEPLISPLVSDSLSHLPPTCIVAAEHDVLLDDSLNLAKALEREGVPVTLHVEPGVAHGYINHGRLVPAADASIKVAARFLAGDSGTFESG